MKTLALLLLLTASALAYTPPKGIPDPAAEFGWEIDRTTPDWPASWLAGTTSATAGYYYVDNTDPSATDSSNTYGHPDLPRATIPYLGNDTLTAGTFVYIHAGTYAPGTMSLSSQGTEEAPIWVTGNPATHPVIQSQMHVGDFAGAAWWIIENLDFEAPGSIDIRPTGTDMTVDHVLVRNCVMTGSGSIADPNGISNGGGSTETNQTSDVVIYNCTITDYGDYNNEPDAMACPVVPESEQACVYNDYNRTRTWILDCTLETPGADSIAGSHSANDTDRLTQYLYIGGNTIVCGGENAIDLKSTRYVVISGNTISGHAHREQGWLVVFHSGSNPVPCRDVAVIFNTIHGGTSGVMGTSTNGTQDILVAGNVIHDIKASYAPQADASFNGWAVGSFATQGTGNFIAHNTVYDCDKGFTATNLEAGNTVEVRGNILQDITGHSLNVDNLAEAFLDSDYNLFDAGSTFFWDNGSRNFAYMQGTAMVEANSVAGDPDFTNAASANFVLMEGSPAIDEGTAGGAYDAFFATFGLSVEFDKAGTARPQNAVWDMGAFEFDGEDPAPGGGAAIGTLTILGTLNVGP